MKSQVSDLIDAFIKKNDFGAAEEKIQELILIDPTNEDYLYCLGRIFQIQGKMKEAEATYKRLININPKNSKALFSLSLQSSKLKDTSINEQIISIDENEFERIREKSDICFAKANIFHMEKKYILSQSFTKRLTIIGLKRKDLALQA